MHKVTCRNKIRPPFPRSMISTTQRTQRGRGAHHPPPLHPFSLSTLFPSEKKCLKSVIVSVGFVFNLLVLFLYIHTLLKTSQPGDCEPGEARVSPDFSHHFFRPKQRKTRRASERTRWRKINEYQTPKKYRTKHHQGGSAGVTTTPTTTPTTTTTTI